MTLTQDTKRKVVLGVTEIEKIEKLIRELEASYNWFNELGPAETFEDEASRLEYLLDIVSVAETKLTDYLRRILRIGDEL